METDAPSGGGDIGGPGAGGTPGFPGDGGFPGQPGMFGDAGFPGQPGFGGQPGMFGQLGFGGRYRYGRSWPGSRGRAPLTGPGLIFALIGFVIFVIIAITVFSHMNSPGFGTPDPSGPCVGGPIQGESGQSLGNGNYRFDCVDGGSTVMHFGN